MEEKVVGKKDAIYNRSERLLGSGVTHITIVDSDTVCITNINRQLMATSENIGAVKVDELKRRLLAINPQAEVIAINGVYNEQTSAEYALDTYDYVIDCIDTVTAKLDVAQWCQEKGIPLISSMGAGNKLDPTKLVFADIFNT